MRLVLVLLATFLQSLFHLFNVQNLIGLYALYNIRQRQMLALAALNRRRRMSITGLKFAMIKRLKRKPVTKNFNPIAVASSAHVLPLQNCKTPISARISDLIDVDDRRKIKNCYFKAIRQDMTCFEAGHRLV